MKVELLAPAKDVSIARSAILSGADAIYIGGNRFGARVNAGNSMSEIEGLVKYAHGFKVKVYMTMNTLLYDNELQEAKTQAQDAYNAGVDALIVQDMAYLEMGLKIELHASTQTFNFTPEKVKFLEDVGFARVVLERSLGCDEIRDIRKATKVELESFIHGAICVGYSGQCYLSEAVTKRSGNRGECAQLCRSNYDLYDVSGRILAKNETILSVGDMYMGERVAQLLECGVCSLKIEGRLKNESYVVNNTAFYNKILNDLGVNRISSGDSFARFEADPCKSFLRIPTRYFFDDKRNLVGAPTKSLGENVGFVESVFNGGFTIKTSSKINNGDGLCWFTEIGLEGINVNKVEGDKIYGNNIKEVKVGQEIFRNFDNKFDVSGKDVDRKIDIEIELAEVIKATDCDGYVAQVELPKFDIAQNETKAIESLKSGFSKSGDSIFRVVDVKFAMKKTPFLPNSTINSLRRDLLKKLTMVRIESYLLRERVFVEPKAKLQGKIDYLGNVSNELAKQFYKKVGVESFEDIVEISGDYEGKVLLRSRYCVRRQRGICPKDNPKCKAEPLFIKNNGKVFKLEFKCGVCEMEVSLVLDK